jgi:hypothetical protein
MTDAAKSILEKEIQDLEKRLKTYEENGAAKLFYSLQRKANEIFISLFWH